MNNDFLHFPVKSIWQSLFTFMCFDSGPFVIRPIFLGIMSYTLFIYTQKQHPFDMIFKSPMRNVMLPWVCDRQVPWCQMILWGTDQVDMVPAHLAHNILHPDNRYISNAALTLCLSTSHRMLPSPHRAGLQVASPDLGDQVMMNPGWHGPLWYSG